MNEDNRPLMVTIRCCTYNHEPYIRQCLEGFVMQKTDFRFEAIVHDDASTDGTAAIVREYAEKYPDIIKPIFETENQYSKHDDSLRHIMDAHTHGKYVALCEGDDYWIDPFKLQKQVEFLEQNADISLCGSNGIILPDNFCERIRWFNNILRSRVLTTEEIVNNWCMPTASLVYRNFCTNNYPEWSRQIVNGDQMLLLMSLLYGKIYCLKDITCVYRRIYGGSIVANQVINKPIKFLLKLLYLYEKYYMDYKNEENKEILKGKIRSIKKELKYEMSLKNGTWIFYYKAYFFYMKKFTRRFSSSLLYKKSVFCKLDKEWYCGR